MIKTLLYINICYFVVQIVFRKCAKYQTCALKSTSKYTPLHLDLLGTTNNEAQRFIYRLFIYKNVSKTMGIILRIY